jgi:hypothetical protein
MQHMKLQGFRHLVFELDDLENAYSDLKAKQITFSNDQDISNKILTHSIFFKNPEGNERSCIQIRRDNKSFSLKYKLC